MYLFVGGTLICVAVMCLVFIFIFTLIGFAKFRSAMDPPLYCKSLAQCFTVMMRMAIIGDLFQVENVHVVQIKYVENKLEFISGSVVTRNILWLRANKKKCIGILPFIVWWFSMSESGTWILTFFGHRCRCCFRAMKVN